MSSLRAGGTAVVPAVRSTSAQIAALRAQVAAPPPVPAAADCPPCRPAVSGHCPEVLPPVTPGDPCPCCGRPRLTSVAEVLRASAQLAAAGAALLPLLDCLRAGVPLLPAERESLGLRRHDLGTALQIAIGLGLVEQRDGRWVAGEVSRG